MDSIFEYPVPTEQELTQKIVEISQRANEIYYAQLYRVDADNESQVTDTAVYKYILGVLIDELEELGVVFTLPSEILLNNRTYVNAMVVLRSKVDSYFLSNTLKAMDSDIVNKITSMLEDDADHSLFIQYLVTEIYQTFPMNEELEFLHLATNELFTNEDRFVEHVQAVIHKMDDGMSNVTIQEDDPVKFAKYSNAHIKAHARFEFALRSLIDKHTNEVKDDNLLRYLNVHDSAHNDNIRNHYFDKLNGGAHTKQKYHHLSYDLIKDVLTTTGGVLIASFWFAYNDMSAMLTELTKDSEFMSSLNQSKLVNLVREIPYTELPLPEVN